MHVVIVDYAVFLVCNVVVCTYDAYAHVDIVIAVSCVFFAIIVCVCSVVGVTVRVVRVVSCVFGDVSQLRDPLNGMHMLSIYG